MKIIFLISLIGLITVIALIVTTAKMASIEDRERELYERLRKELEEDEND